VALTPTARVQLPVALSSLTQAIIKIRGSGVVPCDDKTEAGLAEKMCSILEDEGIKFGYMRGQGHNNGSNMTGIYNGVQVLILKQNAAAL